MIYEIIWWEYSHPRNCQMLQIRNAPLPPTSHCQLLNIYQHINCILPGILQKPSNWFLNPLSHILTILPSMDKVDLFFFRVFLFFLMWTFKKVFIEFVMVWLLLFYILAFGREACGTLAPQPGMEPAPPCIGSGVLTSRTSRKIPFNVQIGWPYSFAPGSHFPWLDGSWGPLSYLAPFCLLAFAFLSLPPWASVTQP